MFAIRHTHQPPAFQPRTMTDREVAVMDAFAGASLSEKAVLARCAVGCLDPVARAKLAQELDRQAWREMKP